MYFYIICWFTKCISYLWFNLFPGTVYQHTYCKTSDIKSTSVENKIVDHSCSWSITCRRCSNYVFIPDITAGFNGSGKDHCMMTPETFEFGDLVWLILEIWQYLTICQIWGMWRMLICITISLMDVFISTVTVLISNICSTLFRDIWNPSSAASLCYKLAKMFSIVWNKLGNKA